MCKYCEGEFAGEKPITPLTSNKSGIKLIVENGFLYAYCKCGTHCVQEIKYCPMCGRKL